MSHPAQQPTPFTGGAPASGAGSHVELGEGRTYYRCDGDPGGAPLVLLHGATVPSWEFDALRPLLVAAGYRTLTFDLYGHGASARPKGPYTLERFRRQTTEIVEAAGLPRPFTLLGHSLGAAIAAAVGTTHASWVERFVLVAPMLDYNATSRWTRLARCPGVGEVLMHVVGVPALIRRRRTRYTQIGRADLIPRFLEQAQSPGYGRALLSMMRSAALGDQTAHYVALGHLKPDVLVLAGSADVVIPPTHIARVRDLLNGHRYSEIPGAAHNLLLTHPHVVAAALAAR
jgi:pimeloyl-ACP methyl ester carboxylesterase